MGERNEGLRNAGLPPVFVASGGAGASGEQLIYTVLAQFTEAEVPVIRVPHIRREKQVKDVVAQAAATRGTIVHTLVDANLRCMLIRLAQERDVVAIDLMGPVLSQLSSVLGQQPLGQPGRYRQLREGYFKRVEAIEFAVRHDDGRNLHELHLAEIVLVGVSRLGKTPLSVYLSMLGWKVANIPLFIEAPPPSDLFEIDPRRVVGLTIDPDSLVFHRRLRGRRIGMEGRTSYTSAEDVKKDVMAARQLCRHHQFPLVNVTGKPIEESANQVIEIVTQRLSDDQGQK